TPRGRTSWRGPGASMARSPTSSTSTPLSSRTSRTAASSGTSFGSTWPPGGSHMPSLGCRWSSTWSRHTTKALTARSRVTPPGAGEAGASGGVGPAGRTSVEEHGGDQHQDDARHRHQEAQAEGAREALANGRHDGEEDQQHAGQEEVARESDQLLLHVGSLARLTRGPARAAGARRR